MNLKVKQFKKRYGFTPLDILKMRVNLHSRHYLTRQECPNSLRYLTGFTIIELLTVMSIIVILFGLLMPAMTLVRTYSKNVKQSAQFHAIDGGLQMYHDDFQGYPPSDRYGGEGGNKEYPGACKLAEAMVGWDLLGFNRNSIFASDGKKPGITLDLYPETMGNPPSVPEAENLASRQQPYVDVSKINAYKIEEFWASTSPTLPAKAIVLCDEFPNWRGLKSAKRIGMPILYYKANISNTKHNFVDRDESTYNWEDNLGIVNQPLPWASTRNHPIAGPGGTSPDGTPSDPNDFYTMTRNPKITSTPKPYNAEGYILISAGNDSLYGTRDDVFNFSKD